ncbi:hypothetical protein O9993_05675 [Vibrio lentus]|nr:hypothetical protein [Vibrio lentus]
MYKSGRHFHPLTAIAVQKGSVALTKDRESPSSSEADNVAFTGVSSFVVKETVSPIGELLLSTKVGSLLGCSNRRKASRRLRL